MTMYKKLIIISCIFNLTVRMFTFTNIITIIKSRQIAGLVRVGADISPQCQPIEGRKRNPWKSKRERAVQTNKEVLLLKPACPSPSNTLSLRLFYGDAEWGMKVLRYSESAARTCIWIPISNQGTTCNPHWHKRYRKCPRKWMHGVNPDLLQHTQNCDRPTMGKVAPFQPLHKLKTTSTDFTVLLI